MKTSSCICAFVLPWMLVSSTSSRAQHAAPILALRGPNHQVCETVTETVGAGGESIRLTNRYIQIATGLNYLRQSNWIPSVEQLEIVNDVAVARQAQYQVSLAANVNSEQAVNLLTPEGSRLISHIVGLSFYDRASQAVVFIARVQDSVGQLTAPNTLLYPDAFDTVRADVRCTCTKAGFEQEVLLRRALPFVPEDFGLDSATTDLEVTTAFIEAPVPASQVRQRENLPDETLRFGSMHMGPGRAFVLNGARDGAVPVRKSWLQVDHWGYLVEAVEYAKVAVQLARLPAPDRQGALPKPAKMMVAQAGDRVRTMPRRAPSQLTEAKVQLAREGTLPGSESGLSIDYTLVLSSNSWRFAGNETYLVSGATYLGNVVLEGGTVIKMTNNAFIDLQGIVSCETGPYRPAIFTAVWC